MNNIKYFLILPIIAITGCIPSVPDLPTQHSYTTEQYDVSTGITLLPSDEMWISFEEIVRLHKEMQACLGLSIDTIDPTVDETVIAWRSFENADGWWEFSTTVLGDIWGFHIVIDGISHIYINTDMDKEPNTHDGFNRDVYTDTQATKHEFIHSINYHAAGHGGEHGEELDRCNAQVNTYN